jgi:hypothetical protein
MLMIKAIRLLKIIVLLISVTLSPFSIAAQKKSSSPKPSAQRLPAKTRPPAESESQTPINTTYKGEAFDREIAGRFAPIFYQAYDEKRFDYITNFDFDGDWRGDNNWTNAANSEFSLRAFVYYAVSETPTHYFIHYAVFHPRDYKGGERRGLILSEVIREGAKIGTQYDPTGRLDEAVLAHENDMEGCLVVVKKSPNKPNKAHLVYVETLAHNKFLKYAPDARASRHIQPVQIDGKQPRLFIEPKGHGIQAYKGNETEIVDKNFILYSFTGRAEDPAEINGQKVGYDLLPLYDTIWSRAQNTPNDTFGEAQEYQAEKLLKALAKSLPGEKAVNLNKLGSAFLGKVGAVNMARPPWGWFDSSERDRPLGEWFFNPAATIKRHFQLDEAFAVVYTHHPYLNIFR